MCWNGVDVLEQMHLQQQQQQRGRQSVEGSKGFSGATGGEQSSLSPDEEQYFRQYNDMLVTYKGKWTDIDLTGSLEPPKDLFIDVRVLKDAGEVQTEYGYVFFQQFQLYLVKGRCMGFDFANCPT
jgi:GINS complex subunit 1